MSLKKYLPVVLTFITAGIVALVAAIFSTSAVEEKSLLAVNHVLELHGYTWVKTDVDGLLIVLHGEASDEAKDFKR